jgi:teichuronic acid exporter
MSEPEAARAVAEPARPMLWSSLESLSLALVSFVMLAMLARYLDAATFGRAAIALGVVQIACSFVESFFHDAVVQRKGLQRNDVDAAHTSGVLLALVLCCAIALYVWLDVALGAGLAFTPAGPGVAELVLWMSPSLLLSAWSAMSIAQLRRGLAMRRLAIAMAGSRLLAGVAAIVALSQGAGVWALVINQNLAALALLGLLLAVRAPTGQLTRDLSGVARMGGYAAWNSASGLINANMSRVFQVACGFVLPAAVVGQVSLALRIVDMLVSVLVTGVARVTLSRLAAAAHAGSEVVPVFIATSRRLCEVMVPLLLLMAVMAEPLVLFIGQGGWAQAGTLVMWFALAQALRSPTFLAGTLFLALGRPRLMLWVSLTELASLALLVVLMQTPLAWAARLLIVLPVVAWMLKNQFSIPLRALLRAVALPVLAAAVMAAALHASLPWLQAWPLPPLGVLLVGGSAGLLLYALLSALLKRTLRATAGRRRPAAQQASAARAS